jgi:hypothetical protein
MKTKEATTFNRYNLLPVEPLVDHDKSFENAIVENWDQMKLLCCNQHQNGVNSNIITGFQGTIPKNSFNFQGDPSISYEDFTNYFIIIESMI